MGDGVREEVGYRDAAAHKNVGIILQSYQEED